MAGVGTGRQICCIANDWRTFVTSSLRICPYPTLLGYLNCSRLVGLWFFMTLNLFGVMQMVMVKVACQRYYIRSALPFGSPVNTNFHLLRMVRYRDCNTSAFTSLQGYLCIQYQCLCLNSCQPKRIFWDLKWHMVRHGFPNKEDDTSQRSPAWKPYLYKGKSKLTLRLGFAKQLILWILKGLKPRSTAPTSKKHIPITVMIQPIWI